MKTAFFASNVFSVGFGGAPCVGSGPRRRRRERGDRSRPATRFETVDSESCGRRTSASVATARTVSNAPSKRPKIFASCRSKRSPIWRALPATLRGSTRRRSTAVSRRFDDASANRRRDKKKRSRRRNFLDLAFRGVYNRFVERVRSSARLLFVFVVILIRRRKWLFRVERF